MPTLTPPHRKYELDYDLIPRLFIVLRTQHSSKKIAPPADHFLQLQQQLVMELSRLIMQCLEFLESLYIRYLGSLCFLLVKVTT